MQNHYGLSKCQNDVEQFHRAGGHPIRFGEAEKLTPDRLALRIRLIAEEAAELMNGLGAPEHEVRGFRYWGDRCRDMARAEDQDLVEIVDGIIDLIYVLLGTAAELGIDLGPAWNEVHRANMRKFGAGAARDAEGKTVKPPGWVGPDIRSAIHAGLREYRPLPPEPDVLFRWEAVGPQTTERKSWIRLGSKSARFGIYRDRQSGEQMAWLEGTLRMSELRALLATIPENSK